MEKKKILLITAIVNAVIWIAIILNIVILYPLRANNAWAYGLILILFGLCSYIIGLFLVENHYLEYIGSGISAIGELFMVWFFMQNTSFWFSPYLIPPIFTFFIMMLLAYKSNSEKKERKLMMHISLMAFSASLFILMIEAAIRAPEFFQTAGIPIWAILVIIFGLLIYIFTTWKILDKPSYLIALSGAFIVNIGIFMLEVYFKFYETTKIFTLNFLIPGLVFFAMLFVNYKISPND